MKAKITFARPAALEQFLFYLRRANPHPSIDSMAADHDISFVVEIGDVAELDRIEELAEAYSGHVEFSK